MGSRRLAEVVLGSDTYYEDETGYLRVPRPGSIEIVMAQPTGLAEIYEGAVVGGDVPLVIDVRSTSITATSTAKEVTITERTISIHERRSIAR